MVREWFNTIYYCIHCNNDYEFRIFENNIYNQVGSNYKCKGCNGHLETIEVNYIGDNKYRLVGF